MVDDYLTSRRAILPTSYHTNNSYCVPPAAEHNNRYWSFSLDLPPLINELFLRLMGALHLHGDGGWHFLPRITYLRKYLRLYICCCPGLAARADLVAVACFSVGIHLNMLIDPIDEIIANILKISRTCNFASSKERAKVLGMGIKCSWTCYANGVDWAWNMLSKKVRTRLIVPRLQYGVLVYTVADMYQY